MILSVSFIHLSVGVVLVFSFLYSSYWILLSPTGLNPSSYFLDQLSDSLSLNSAKHPFSYRPSADDGYWDFPVLPHGVCGDNDGALSLFGEIFVVSLPRRTDRKADMEKLRMELGLDWTYVDATSADDGSVLVIMDEVRRMRTNALKPPSDSAGSFEWPAELDDLLATAATGLLGSDLWTLKSPTSPHEIPEGASGDPAAEHIPDPLTCATRNNITGPPYTPSLPTYLHLTAAKIACWYSHLPVIRKIAADIGARPGCNSAFLVMEDDIDAEKDISERLRQLWPSLPIDWDIVFLGHCWSNETRHSPIATTRLTTSPSQSHLHPSNAPKCTHAYALSRTGAFKLLNHLRFPPFAYSRALDQAISWLVLSGRLNSFSIVPSVVVQRKIVRSDVDAGREGLGSDWKESLFNGVFHT